MAEKKFVLDSLISKVAPDMHDEQPSLSWDKLADDCILGNYVLILGPEAMLSYTSEQEELQKAHGNSESLIQSLMQEYKRQEAVRSLGFYRQGQTLYEDICDTLYLIREAVSSSDIEPSLRNIMDIRAVVDDNIEVRLRCFPIVITTTYDPYVETLMREIWGECLQVKNIYDTGTERDITMINSEYKTLEPTLYYAFGKAEYMRRENNVVRRPFTITDNDKLLIVDQWLRNPPKNIKQLLSEKRTLAIGCKYDDWLFRMLWYIWRGSVKNLSGGEVILDFSQPSPAEETQLKNYLKTERITFFDNARDFMQTLSEKIGERYVEMKRDMHLLQPLRRDRWEDDGIFLSYASEDFLIVRKIYERLTALGLNVWMDVRLESGDEYNKRIENAINSCKVFVPIVSKQTEQILKTAEGSERYFYKEEWMLADKRIKSETNLGKRTMRVLPVLTDGININKTDALIPDFIKAVHCFDLSTKKIDMLGESVMKLVIS